MKEFDFNKLKDLKIDFPESWIDNALEIPSKTKKKALPVRFYRYAVGIAACLVLAAALTSYFMFGLNKTGDLINSGIPSSSDITEDGKTSAATDDPTLPQDATAALADNDNNAGAITAEPSENGEGEDNNAPQTNDQNNNSALNSQNKQAAQSGSHKNNIQKQKSVSSGESNPLTPIPVTEPPAVQNPTEEAVDDPEPATEENEPGSGNSKTDYWDIPLAANDDYFFTTTVDSSLAQGDIYCRVVSVKGTALGFGGLFDESRMADKTDLGNGKTELDFDTTDLPGYQNSLKMGEPYRVIFYNSKGETIKQGWIDVYYSTYFDI